MSYELILLRHGKSDWDNNETDFNRPVTDRGKRGAQRIGVWLAKNGLKPDMVISSPAERARLTAQKMMKAMGETDHYIIYDKRVYEATLNDILAVLNSISVYTKRVILVGHNPGLEQLLIYLCNNNIAIPANGKLLPTATLAHLSLACEWKKIKKNTAELLKIQRPKDLPKTFPYPSFDGNEQRIRPSYYYQQSSVIPYHYNNNGELEILLILSSKKKHYVIPKGIKEPGLTPRESAEKEAQEEAGVIGNVALHPIGIYHYKKWEATCSVNVYPMEVTLMLDEEHWEEKHRTREWVKPDVASIKLFQDALKPMILDLVTSVNEQSKSTIKS
ncbi:MAG: histidine phosphatase family protein [gamma proteobacterium symbiont of Bathyaustriella thionipta]|nr:histidine phosphatase family protein [gamma proteobacterium symbiont of Bathyaustriella thionipta]MCU7950683.1 histidine phosphatase family protein [gamma proteobacterium symbiont of Bathyaustriella thionipta]MCU7952601.1 histidine phosphatase family protein [gamma proteobacterium symbiont of Bathyaustriella thionipta]MCU7957183.1 histidine phosphatase family protein [gamma proteobacterium symbiont of Bathyaustriella thionipta]MCU7968060.1 histidine phosphatase family protein [gamma proteoba